MAGEVALGMKSRPRRPLTITYAKPGAVLALAEAIAGGMYLTSAVAATNIEVRFLPRADLLQSIQCDPVTGMELVETLSANLSTMYATIREFKFHHRPTPNGTAIN